MKKGRPKMTAAQHLGETWIKKNPGWRERFEERVEKSRKPMLPPNYLPHYNEAKEMFIQLYEEKGPTECLNLLQKFNCMRLQDMKRTDYWKFIRLIRAKLGKSQF